MARTLTMAEVRELQTLPGTRGSAARFMFNGASFDILNGESSSRGANVIHQRVYWDLSHEQAKRAAALTGTRLVFEAPEGDDGVRAAQEAEHIATIRATGAQCRCHMHRTHNGR